MRCSSGPRARSRPSSWSTRATLVPSAACWSWWRPAASHTFHAALVRHVPVIRAALRRELVWLDSGPTPWPLVCGDKKGQPTTVVPGLSSGPVLLVSTLARQLHEVLQGTVLFESPNLTFLYIVGCYKPQIVFQKIFFWHNLLVCILKTALGKVLLSVSYFYSTISFCGEFYLSCLLGFSWTEF